METTVRPATQGDGSAIADLYLKVVTEGDHLGAGPLLGGEDAEQVRAVACGGRGDDLGRAPRDRDEHP